MSGTQGTPRRWGAVEETAGDFWATRPRRPRVGRKVAGVAAGIGRRYGVDPVLVRVAFAMLTFSGGVGLLLYVLGWLLLPEDGDEVSAVEGLLHRGRASTSGALTAALALGLIPISAYVFDGDVSAFVSLALAGGALYLLHRARGQENREFGAAAPAPAWSDVPPATQPGPTGTPGPTGPVGPMGQTGAMGPAGPAGVAEPPTVASATQPFSTQAAAPAPPPAEPTPPPAPTPFPGATFPPVAEPAASTPPADPLSPTPSAPPAWDPLGTAPFAWDLPEPAPSRVEEPPTPRRRSRVTAVTFALSLVAGGVGMLLVPKISWSQVPGIVLAVLGLGMVVGSFVRGGRGLIPLAIPVAFFAMASGAGMPVNQWEGAGTQHASPTAVTDVQPSYTLSAGDIDLDLSQLRLGKDDQVTTRVGVNLGNVTVRVPRDADVQVECTSGLGEVQCLGQWANGTRRSMRIEDNGPDGPGGGKIVLDARTGMGNVEVLRD
ncbi:PspC domain-containing protein [Streptoalloteichus hindustanus]|uniref:Phage shock protein C (PspC) family protein n=1 Tax=Streptoalloteichus hindustanus TaxID=2017 RepID=A0A1M4T893_STRHI|nr:PspC domain-containing protein [Streptoalloteichus hindustanus]SHE40630.1 phage shock protein C (PspC) family protein [Streptoalloteichus hindustanus]